jgi:CheY-like chemotaxis protein
LSIYPPFPKPSSGSKKKWVLIAEDETISAYMLASYLDEAGYSYRIAADGHTAFTYLQRHPDQFFVVLADRIMPKMHGLTLLKKMKQTENLAHIPLILLTGEASQEEHYAALREGVYDFIYKPIGKDLLVALLKKVQRSIK